jgi:aspartate/tyrosine/aromatic aminotransferase
MLSPFAHLAASGGELMVCNSFSKNFGLYGERVGGVSAVTRNGESAAAMRSQMKLTIRTMYSNPPIHGGLIVSTILSDDELSEQWRSELAEIRERIQKLRAIFVGKMNSLVPSRDWEYINQQRGMFSFSGLTVDQVNQLREQHSIYALTSGRINIAGINQSNLDRICNAIASVM